jgi:hypothetical protein
MQADAAHAAAVLERQSYSLFIFRGDEIIGTAVDVLDNERKPKEGWVCEHVCYGLSTCIDDAKAQVGWMPKHDVSPFSANAYERTPPMLASPSTAS